MGKRAALTQAFGIYMKKCSALGSEEMRMSLMQAQNLILKIFQNGLSFFSIRTNYGRIAL